MSATAMLPALRPDLVLSRGPDAPNGSPTYLIFDPCAATYDRIGWREYEVLRRLRHPVACAELLARLERETTLAANAGEVAALCRDAAEKGLTRNAGVRPVGTLMQQRRRRGGSGLLWLFRTYLFFRVPFFHPDRFLQRTLPLVRMLAHPLLLALYALVLVGGCVLTLQELDRYANTFLYFFHWQGLFAYFLALGVVKAVHELAHAYTARHFGVRVPTLGLAFILLWPIPYCDVTDGWKLPSRWPRLWISAAGVVAELVIAAFCLSLWALTEPGPLQSVCFLLSSVSLASTLLVNLNPGMRFDGYYILGDLWGVENLQERAFAVTRNRMRRCFFGMEEPLRTPAAGPGQTAGFLLYTVYAWLYRAALYFGIAAILYARFGRLLGAVLFTAAAATLLVAPVLREARALWQRRHQVRHPWRLAGTGAVLLGLLLWLGLPRPQRLSAPAILLPRKLQVLYTPAAGRLARLNLPPLAQVRAGQLLAEIETREQTTRLAVLAAETRRLRALLRHANAQPDSQGEVLVLEQELARTLAQQSSLQEQVAQGAIRAQVDGTVVDWQEGLQVGQPVQARTVLGRIARRDQLQVTAYVREEDVDDLPAGSAVRFYAPGLAEPLEGRVRTTDALPVTVLEHPALASTRGGELPVREEAPGRLRLQEATYRIEIDIRAPHPPPPLGLTGRVYGLTAGSHSKVARWYRALRRILTREATL